MKNKLCSLLALSLTVGLISDAHCRPSSSRSSSSSSSRSSSSWGSKSSSSNSSSSGYKPNTSTSSSNSPRVASKAEVSKYQSAAKSGKAFTTKEAAMADFKSKNADKYPSRYSSEPTTRPSHIPQTYRDSSGNSYNITYNQGMGGYGYMNALGTFILYDALTDVAMASTLMSNNGYHIGPPVVASSGWSTFWTIIGVIAMIGVISIFIKIVLD